MSCRQFGVKKFREGGKGRESTSSHKTHKVIRRRNKTAVASRGAKKEVSCITTALQIPVQCSVKVSHVFDLAHGFVLFHLCPMENCAQILNEEERGTTKRNSAKQKRKEEKVKNTCFGEINL